MVIFTDLKNSKSFKFIMLISIMTLCFLAGYILTLDIAYNQAGEYYGQRWKYECIIPKEMPEPGLFQWAREHFGNITIGSFNTTNANNTT